jgi:simple sugar transport system ATP-binding protein
MAHPIVLTGITKRFPGVIANDGVDLEIQPGTIHALLGENGAGKTTLMNILAGRYRPDAGDIRIGDRPARFQSPRDALRAGIGMVHQHFMLVPTQTVAENVLLGQGQQPLLFSRRRAEAAVRRISESYGMAVDPAARVDELSVGEQQRVEILKLLQREADLLILDEPTAVLTPGEIDGFFATIKTIVRRGKSVIFITHKLDEVMEIADRITVLRRGRVIAHMTPDEVGSRRELARLMVGREVVLAVDKPAVPPGDVVLELRGCAARGDRGQLAFQGVTFAVRKGEIFSLVGVAGNGQAELVSAITGRRGLSAGEIRLCGRPLTRRETQAIALVPEDRTRTGSVPSLDLTDNYLLTTVSRFTRRGLLMAEAARREVAEALTRFRVRATGTETLARELSGGNLQKLVLAREFSRRPALLVAEHPTHGLDVGATEEVWAELLRLREQAAILLVSGDLAEALTLSDRIGVLFRGRLMGVISATQEDAIGEIGPMMAGMAREP